MSQAVEIIDLFAYLWEYQSLESRFVYTFWGFLLFMYWYSKKYDEYHNKTTRNREPINTNYFYGIWVSAAAGLLPFYVKETLHKEWPITENPDYAYWLGAAGFALLTIGLFSAIYGRLALDGQWGSRIYDYTLTENNERLDKLQTAFIYAWVRHPIYLGQILMAIGTFLVFQSWYLSAFPVLATFFAVMRARAEDKYLLERFDEEFSKYRGQVHMWVPNKPKTKKSKD